MNKKITKKELYNRQTTLKEFGDKGQEELQQASILVVGCGGLGCAAAVYLAASGIGKLHLVDFDVIDVSNLHRQVFYKTEDLGKPKSVILGRHIKAITPFVDVHYTNAAIDKSIINNIISNFDIVVDCTDSLPVKYLLNDACVLHDKVLVYGSLYKFDGYVATFNALNNGKRTCNLRDAFPEISKKTVPNCSEVGTLNPIVGIIGIMQANEVIKIITNIGKPLINEILIYNSLENSQYRMKLKQVFTKQMILEKFETETYFDTNCDLQDKDLLISKDEFLRIRSKVEIISVIEDESISLPFMKYYKLPLSKLNVETLKLDESKEYVVVCNKGVSSYKATEIILDKYPYLNVYSLEGGISGLTNNN